LIDKSKDTKGKRDNIYIYQLVNFRRIIFSSS